MQRRKFLQNISIITASATFPKLSQAETGKKKKYFTTAFITDIHIKPSEIAEAGMQKALQNINQLKQQPDLIFNGGDSIMDALAADKRWRVAVNQEMAAMDTPLCSGDEVAIFPPVTGG